MGYHLYHFYEDDIKLVKTLADFFIEGLRKREYCIWIPREGLSLNKAIDLIRSHIPEIEDYLLNDQMRIELFEDWYLTEDGVFDKDAALIKWRNAYDSAMKRGFPMVRAAGDGSSLSVRYWDKLVEYEAIINDSINEINMVALCTYNGRLYKPSQIRDILNNHFCPLTATP